MYIQTYFQEMCQSDLDIKVTDKFLMSIIQ